MGEQRAVRESIVDNIVCLHSFYADKLIYVHNTALGYNKCKFNSTLEAALMIKSKSINGEMSHAC